MSYRDMPRHGDVHGDPHRGHKVEQIHAAVVVFEDGSEGLVSQYTFADDERTPIGRVTFVTSDPKTLPVMQEMIAAMTAPPGGRFEWRIYTQQGSESP